MDLFEPKLMRLLSFLTRGRGWLSVPEIARDFRLDGQRLDVRTVHRWFAFLREEGGFVYYPYPKASAMGLQEVLVRIHRLREPRVLGILPFGASFNVDVALSDGHSFVTQTYWVPGTALREFEEFWEGARELGLLGSVDVVRTRNTHFLFSPFHEVIQPDGRAQVDRPADNTHFGALIRHHLSKRFDVRVAEPYAESPLVIPIVVEHIWGYYSSRHVWDAIRERGEARIRKYVRGPEARALEKPGAALKLLQRQWQSLLDRFDEVFIQPRVFFNWPVVRDAMVLSFFLRTDAADRMVEAAVKASDRAIVTSLRPAVGPGGWFHLSCFLPNDQLQPVMGIVDTYHKGREPPLVAVQDRKATLELFKPEFCRVDWRLFDPETLTWTFDGEHLAEQLKQLKVSAA